MANLFLRPDHDDDIKRVMLLATGGMINEYTRAIYITVTLWIESLERQMRNGAQELNNDQLRYQVAAMNTLKSVLDLPTVADNYINEMSAKEQLER